MYASINVFKSSVVSTGVRLLRVNSIDFVLHIRHEVNIWLVEHILYWL